MRFVVAPVYLITTAQTTEFSVSKNPAQHFMIQNFRGGPLLSARMNRSEVTVSEGPTVGGSFTKSRIIHEQPPGTPKLIPDGGGACETDGRVFTARRSSSQRMIRKRKGPRNDHERTQFLSSNGRVPRGPFNSSFRPTSQNMLVLICRPAVRAERNSGGSQL